MPGLDTCDSVGVNAVINRNHFFFLVQVSPNYTCAGETSLIGANPNATLADIMDSEDPRARGGCRPEQHDDTAPLTTQVRTGQTKLSNGDQVRSSFVPLACGPSFLEALS